MSADEVAVAANASETSDIVTVATAMFVAVVGIMCLCSALLWVYFIKCLGGGDKRRRRTAFFGESV